ncbi:MAG: hypothetical protein FWD22_03565 [Treponema sp.]|nr:hypothetical protein [Treponema sp.]
MDRIGYFFLYIATAVYLFINGIWGFDGGGDFAQMSKVIFGGSDIGGIFTIVLAVIGVVAGALLILQIFKIAIPRIELMMLIVIIVWAVFIVVVDILGLLKGDVKFNLEYLAVLAGHLMVLGALITSSKSA